MYQPTEVTTSFVPERVMLKASSFRFPVHRFRIALELTSLRGGAAGSHCKGDHMFGRLPSCWCTISTMRSMYQPKTEP